MQTGRLAFFQIAVIQSLPAAFEKFDERTLNCRYGEPFTFGSAMLRKCADRFEIAELKAAFIKVRKNLTPKRFVI